MAGAAATNSSAAADGALPPAGAVATDSGSSTKSPPRRGFFRRCVHVLCGSGLAVGLTALATTHLVWLLGALRFLMPNARIEAPTTFRAGPPDQLAPGDVDTRHVARFGAWIVRSEYDGRPQIYALRAVCTHLGCTPLWLEAEQKFKCPCHGSGFYKDGIHFEGPAPRPLERYAIRLAEDGQLEVDTSRSFQQELGEWQDPDCFVEV